MKEKSSKMVNVRVRLEKEIIERIDYFVSIGYAKSREEFIINAIKDHLEILKRQEKMKQFALEFESISKNVQEQFKKNKIKPKGYCKELAKKQEPH